MENLVADLSRVTAPAIQKRLSHHEFFYQPQFNQLLVNPLINYPGYIFVTINPACGFIFFFHSVSHFLKDTQRIDEDGLFSIPEPFSGLRQLEDKTAFLAGATFFKTAPTASFWQAKRKAFLL